MQERGLVQLSREVGQEELNRNTVRVPALGWCGFLSLEWASRCACRDVEIHSDRPLDLRSGMARDRMLSFLATLTIGSEDVGVIAKIQGLMAHVVHACRGAWTEVPGYG